MSDLYVRIAGLNGMQYASDAFENYRAASFRRLDSYYRQLSAKMKAEQVGQSKV